MMKSDSNVELCRMQRMLSRAEKIRHPLALRAADDSPLVTDLLCKIYGNTARHSTVTLEKPQQ